MSPFYLTYKHQFHLSHLSLQSIGFHWSETIHARANLGTI